MKNEETNIEWARYTFNGWRGCTKVSAGCANCYAETLSKRNPALLGEWGPGKPRVLAKEAMWQSPLKWDKDAESALKKWEYERDVCDANKIPYTQPKPERPRVFCASLGDWLDDEVPIEWLIRLLALIVSTPGLDWLLLSKRLENLTPRMSEVMRTIPTNDCTLAEAKARALAEALLTGGGTVVHNIWLGTSVEDQAAADTRIPLLLEIPAKRRFLSCEPLLGPVELLDTGTGWPFYDLEGKRTLHWVIAGGESGGPARPMHPDWVRNLRDECKTVGVPFLFKQWGEFIPAGHPLTEGLPIAGTKLLKGHRFPDHTLSLRVGKKYAGRTLDGQIHHAFPQP